MKKVLSNKKIIIGIALLVVIIILAATLPGGNRSSGVISCAAGTVVRADLKETISIKGSVEGSDCADIYSASNYKITGVNVSVGDIVTKGQILATLDAGDLSDEYGKALIAMNEAKRTYEASQLLFNEGAVSKSEYLSAKAAYDTSVLALNAFNISESSAITSPINGTVTRVNATAGKLASSGGSTGEPLFVIEDLENLQMKVKISEYDISSVKLNQPVTISAEVLGNETVTGIVSHIAPTGEQRDQSSKEMVIPVVISIDKGSSLMAGVTAKAEILTSEACDVLTVPIDAILEDPVSELSYVFIVNDDNTLTKTEVTVGLESDLYAEISGAGINEGMRVVLAPTHDYYDGMQVSISEADGSLNGDLKDDSENGTAAVSTAE